MMDKLVNKNIIALQYRCLHSHCGIKYWDFSTIICCTKYLRLEVKILKDEQNKKPLNIFYSVSFLYVRNVELKVCKRNYYQYMEKYEKLCTKLNMLLYQ